jgi:GTP-binding protein Era
MPRTTKTKTPAEKAAKPAAPKKTRAKAAAPKQAAPKKAPQKPVFKTGYVALVGRPNTGKSTLLNALLGQKLAIVSDKPQTTRISILGIKTTDKGQTIFIDNPGIHKPLHTLNKRMMNFVYSSLETSDVVCLLVDATEKFGHGDEYVLEILRRVKTPVFLLINKVDIVRKDTILPIIGRYNELFPFREIIPISALKGVNLDVLERLLTAALPEAEKIYSDEEISDQSERFLFAEIIREKILSKVTQELPFVTAVYIEAIEKKAQANWKKRDYPQSGTVPLEGPRSGTVPLENGGTEFGRTRPVTLVRASIFVEKDNHRKIVIGRHGSLVKQIGIEARQEIAEYVGHKVYLELQVRVREDWRNSEDVLDLIEGQKG